MDSQKIKSLQSYLVRLHQGEDLASVRREFEKDFASVSTEDIMEAEQDLLQAGKLSENMGHLCDLHSCLLHGKMETMGEQFPEGHPLQLFLKENEAIEIHGRLRRLPAAVRPAQEEGAPVFRTAPVLFSGETRLHDSGSVSTR